MEKANKKATFLISEVQEKYLNKEAKRRKYSKSLLIRGMLETYITGELELNKKIIELREKNYELKKQIEELKEEKTKGCEFIEIPKQRHEATGKEKLKKMVIEFYNKRAVYSDDKIRLKRTLKNVLNNIIEEL